MKTNPSSRQDWLIIIAGVGLIVLMADWLIFTPLGHLWQIHAAEIVQLRQSVANGRSLSAHAAETRRTWTEMQSGALPKDAAQAEQDLITAFDRWGRTSNIELGSIKPQWKRGATDHSSLLECRVDATGTLPALTRFMYELELSPLALRVDSVELIPHDDNGQKLGLSLIVNGLRLVPLEGRQ